MPLKKNDNKVAIVMGSQSDYSTLKYCYKVLKIFKITFKMIIANSPINIPGK